MTRAQQKSSQRPELTVLVVDDNPMLRLTLAQDISDAGFRVREAGSADEAETVLRTDARVDLIVTDVEMPGSKDGLALAALARSKFPSVPIIVVSGRATPASAANVADAFFAKPYDIARLVQRIRQLLSGSSSGEVCASL